MWFEGHPGGHSLGCCLPAGNEAHGGVLRAHLGGSQATPSLLENAADGRCRLLLGKYSQCVAAFRASPDYYLRNFVAIPSRFLMTQLMERFAMIMSQTRGADPMAVGAASVVWSVRSH